MSVTSDDPRTDPGPLADLHRSVRAAVLAVALVAGAAALGLAVGAVTFHFQSRLHGASNALVNSESTWLLAPFAVGLLTRSRSVAAIAGLVACLAQLVGYDGAAHAQGYATGGGVDTLWALIAVCAGPVFGCAGHITRFGRPEIRGLGPATLAAAFAAEGYWDFLRVLDDPGTAALWFVFAGGISFAGLRGARGWRWLALTLPVALLAVAVTPQLFARLA